MFQNIVNQILYWLWPSRILKHFSSFLDRWQRADAREKGILLLVFSPLAVCLGGLLFSVFSFVLFVLPSFILRVLGWGLLAGLCDAGGSFLYERATGKGPHARATADPGAFRDAPYTDVSFTENHGTGEAQAEDQGRREDIQKRWFERIRGMRWKR